MILPVIVSLDSGLGQVQGRSDVALSKDKRAGNIFGERLTLGLLGQT